MIGSEDLVVVGGERLEDRDRLGGAPYVVIRAGEVVGASERLAMPCAEEPLAIGEHRLYTHVIRELKGEPIVPAEEQIQRARKERPGRSGDADAASAGG